MRYKILDMILQLDLNYKLIEEATSKESTMTYKDLDGITSRNYKNFESVGILCGHALKNAKFK